MALVSLTVYTLFNFIAFLGFLFLKLCVAYFDILFADRLLHYFISSQDIVVNKRVVQSRKLDLSYEIKEVHIAASLCTGIQLIQFFFLEYIFSVSSFVSYLFTLLFALGLATDIEFHKELKCKKDVCSMFYKMKYKRLKSNVIPTYNQVIYELWNPYGLLHKKLDSTIKSERFTRECEICLESHFLRCLTKPSSCDHWICYGCFESYIVTEAKSSHGATLRCPHNEESCGSFLSRDLDYLVDTNNTREGAEEQVNAVHIGFLKAALGEFQYLFRCPGPDCRNVQIYDNKYEIKEDHYMYYIEEEKRVRTTRIVPKVLEITKKTKKGLRDMFGRPRRVMQHPVQKYSEVSEYENKVAILCQYAKTRYGVELRKFKCEACEYSFCISCREVWSLGEVEHNDLSCKDYRKRAKLDQKNPELVLHEIEMKEKMKSGIVKKCPKCDVIIEKNLGCNHMTCTHCRYEFCWLCSKKHKTCSC